MSLSMQALVRLVAACPTFQAVTSCFTADEAYERVHWPEARDYDFMQPASPVDERPRAVVSHTDDYEWESHGPGSPTRTGSFDLSFEFTIPEPYRGRRCDSQIWFDNQWSNILEEMGQRRHDFGYLYMHRATKIAGPTEGQDSKPVDADYWFGVTLRIRWPN